jgi:hypothetical protein
MAGGAETHATTAHEGGADQDHGGEEELEADEMNAADAGARESDHPQQRASESPAAAGADSESPERQIDQRLARPEPLEQAFGAEAHSAERTASDPAPAAGAPATPRGDTPDDSQ